MRKLQPLIVVAACGFAACARSASPATANAPATPARQEATPSRSAPGAGGLSVPNADPFPSTYRTFPSRTTLIRNATIMTAVGPSIANASVLLRDGKIAAVGTNI